MSARQLEVGDHGTFTLSTGEKYLGRVTALTDDTVTIGANTTPVSRSLVVRFTRRRPVNAS